MVVRLTRTNAPSTALNRARKPPTALTTTTTAAPTTTDAPTTPPVPTTPSTTPTTPPSHSPVYDDHDNPPFPHSQPTRDAAPTPTLTLPDLMEQDGDHVTDASADHHSLPATPPKPAPTTPTTTAAPTTPATPTTTAPEPSVTVPRPLNTIPLTPAQQAVFIADVQRVSQTLVKFDPPLCQSVQQEMDKFVKSLDVLKYNERLRRRKR